MQSRASLLCQLYGKLSALQASLNASYLGMELNVRVVAVERLVFSHVCVDNIGILAMGHYGQRAFFEYGFERLVVVNKHVSGRRAHENLHATYLIFVELLEHLGIAVRCSEEERIVYMAALGCMLKLLVKVVDAYGLRLGVRHVEEGSNASCGSCGRFALHISLVCQSGIAEMNVVVNHARHQQHSLAEDYFSTLLLCLAHKIVVHGSTFINIHNLDDDVIIDQNGAHFACALVYNHSIVKKLFSHGFRNSQMQI